MNRNSAGNHATACIDIDGHASDDRLIRDAEGAAFLSCSKATWWRRVADGTLPPPIKIGGMSRWRLFDIKDAINRAASKREK